MYSTNRAAEGKGAALCDVEQQIQCEVRGFTTRVDHYAILPNVLFVLVHQGRSCKLEGDEERFVVLEA